MTRATKPARIDKVLAWRQTYHEVLEVLCGVGSMQEFGPDHPTDALKAEAARTAALLVQGVDVGDSDSRDR